jgi:hypothetical protein
MAITIEKNQAAGGMRAMREFADAGIGDGLRDGRWSSFFSVWREDTLVMKKINGHFGHHNFHDALAVTGAGDAACFGIRIAAAADER